MVDLVGIIKNLGLTTKAARVYLAALELGEASVQELAAKAKIKRTTLYYILEELIETGVLISTKTGKRVRYVPEEPATLLKNARGKIADFEESLVLLEEKAAYIRRKPRVYFLYGASGFKQVWDMILGAKHKEYRILTEGENFLEYAKEKYIIQEIIAKKKKLGISSRQLITPSEYAKKIIAKDATENRVSKLLPPGYALPFTEIIGEGLVAFISPRFNNMIFIVENDAFAKTRKSVFDLLWNSIR
ncbi:MAG: hypothetical protein A3I44_04465 [Candidatus Sungbacteria bacterium RIFCSPLOWO2_02_FULL_51_17]|uniref:Transcription regulator TrmB N-terminal domain-containing protein n=1 Tax=Candidatus Sungbacteria bacterium RIFCSPHIGHO2_02_FULL_51_29 TaxID=1802273 RepID=A0A1G2KQ90_9BACT|nr:MAG: hypothetical protein A2676_02955 [Candidatus Sungbacteria bacterium RIFCSPHIGHO2_01_FULL_51_22]OHA01586.1 MAG: hypothetical protein A3C16_00410 [Candidatus Sungbacteria bacterium RIFCSPHIGHO2_02_FULL_51_29]OHA04674.1 MAG: hypothetical protein A3B29_01935 [Candidatus Sungbacteria bacterium RIFCSPLOWO2_01_FULL_51_34]OHA12146.1 MAG: hypothetical protein A3I44_04465 [Candidatus Sungbacteria bacterium RIFCSPLOWO2_02_FULL_51_17]